MKMRPVVLMKSVLFGALVCWGNFSMVSAQSEYISNPSFNGIIGQENVPTDWFFCNPNCTPDTQPFDAKLTPPDGQTYLGLVMRGPEVFNLAKNEDVDTHLLKPLKKDSTYILAIDLAIDPTIVNYSSTGDTLYYNKSARLRISLGNQPCSVGEVVYISRLISNTSWKRYFFEITPKLDTYNYLKLEIYDDTLKPAYMLLDNIQIKTHMLRGESSVCAGQKAIGYTLYPKESCWSGFQWKYSGQGATIKGNSDSITIDYSANASSGILTATFNNCGKGKDSLQIAVSVNSPPRISDITGSNEVCSGWQNYYYYTQSNSNVLNYVWSYSGTGLAISGSTYRVPISFSANATSGYLSVAGENECGTGPSSTLFPITINHVPGDCAITGKAKVCKNQQMVTFRTAPARDAESYYWSYSGTGASISGSSESVQIYFYPFATSGDLRVVAQNKCGSGNVSQKFPITFDTVPARPSNIIGKNDVCVGQGKYIYSISPVKKASDYTWNYTGTGAVISEQGDSAEVTFSESATNGVLSVNANNQCGAGQASPGFPISVGAVPYDAGYITGPDEICASSKNISYNTFPIKNATSYLWEYSGSGATIRGTSDNVSISFPKGATSGYLTVTGSSKCGIGAPSPAFSITVNDCDKPPPDLNIPNSFSPNGDEINDYFVIRGLRKNALLIILDKFGKLVFESKDYQNEWDGRDTEGNLLPTDTYWYVLELPGYTMNWKGFVYLKR